MRLKLLHKQNQQERFNISSHLSCLETNRFQRGERQVAPVCELC